MDRPPLPCPPTKIHLMQIRLCTRTDLHRCAAAMSVAMGWVWEQLRLLGQAGIAATSFV